MQRSLSRLQTFFGHLGAEELLRIMIKEEFKDKIALLSSFGADSALLIDLVSKVDPHLPVLFLETEKHFPETLAYVEEIKQRHGLTNIIYIKPDSKLVQNIDKSGELWQHQPNRCCWLRKVEPLNRTIKEMGLEALITGRKSFQTENRHELPSIELGEDEIFKINPLIHWDKSRIKDEFLQRKLIQHPLVAQGYLSIGCAPCTRAVKPGEDERAGRWAHTGTFPGGKQKEECGIHVSQEGADWTV